jgi:hypothetical protein
VKRIFISSAVAALCAGAVIQETGLDRIARAIGGGVAASPALGVPTNGACETASVLPSLTELIHERKVDFQRVVFDPVHDAVTNACAVAPRGPATSLGTTANKALRPGKFENGMNVESEGELVLMVVDSSLSQPCQKLVVRLDSGYMLLVSHETARAEPVENLTLGARVAFAGQFVQGQNGDEVCKTCRSSAGDGGGWIRVGGRVYQ